MKWVRRGLLGIIMPTQNLHESAWGITHTHFKSGAVFEYPLARYVASPHAPADLIAVRGDATQNFKPLEYPKLVISGGKMVVNYVDK